METENTVWPEIPETMDDFLIEELEIRLELQGCVSRCVAWDWLGNCTIGQTACP